MLRCAQLKSVWSLSEHRYSCTASACAGARPSFCLNPSRQFLEFRMRACSTVLTATKPGCLAVGAVKCRCTATWHVLAHTRTLASAETLVLCCQHQSNFQSITTLLAGCWLARHRRIAVFIIIVLAPQRHWRQAS